MLATMLLLVPSAPWRSSFESTAVAIAEAAESDPLWPEWDDGVARTAALLTAFAYTESRMKPDAVDRGHTTWGLFQISPQWAPRSELLDPPHAARHAIRLLRESMGICAKRPEAERWSWFTNGTAGCPESGYRRSAWRHGIALRLLRDFPMGSD